MPTEERKKYRIFIGANLQRTNSRSESCDLHKEGSWAMYDCDDFDTTTVDDAVQKLLHDDQKGILKKCRTSFKNSEFLRQCNKVHLRIKIRYYKNNPIIRARSLNVPHLGNVDKTIEDTREEFERAIPEQCELAKIKLRRKRTTEQQMKSDSIAEYSAAKIQKYTEKPNTDMSNLHSQSTAMDVDPLSALYVRKTAELKNLLKEYGIKY